MSKVAIVVVHGMGKQVRFEPIQDTIGLLARTATLEQPTAHIITTEPHCYRAETVIDGHDIHIYEAYWAPLTEGLVRLSDCFLFLIGAGWAGLQGSFSRFYRWMFGGIQDLGHPGWRTSGYLALAMLEVVALSLIFLMLILVSVCWLGRGVLGLSVSSAIENWIPTAMAEGGLLVVALAVVFFLCVKVLRPFPQLAQFFGFILVIGPIKYMVVEILRLAGVPIMTVLPESAWIAWAGFVALCFLCLGARAWLIQYIGDLAVYLSSHTLNRFADAREKIQTRTKEALKTVYDQEYDRVILLGHSLGSVVAYDSYNALIRDALQDSSAPADPANSHAETISKRTTFITFGSPLDKSAFIFRSQMKMDPKYPVREQLAAAMQPMITAEGFRPSSWTNFWTPLDWVSGELRYYDPPSGGGVENVVDKNCNVLIAGHSLYWVSPLLSRHITDAISR